MKKIIRQELDNTVLDINQRVKVLQKTKKVEEEFLHDLRLSIKYFKAIYRLCSAFSIQIPKETYRSIKYIHQVGGGIRDTQVQQELLTEIEVYTKQHFKKLQNHLCIDEKNATKQFKKATFKKVKMPEISWRKISSSDLEKEIMQRLKKNANEKNLHEKRKVVKEMMYWYQLLLLKEKKKSWETMRLELKKQGSFLGTWHDYDNFIEYINSKKLSSKKYNYLTSFLKYKNQLMVY